MCVSATAGNAFTLNFFIPAARGIERALKRRLALRRTVVFLTPSNEWGSQKPHNDDTNEHTVFLKTIIASRKGHEGVPR
jgi:hypothetical protein